MIYVGCKIWWEPRWYALHRICMLKHSEYSVWSVTDCMNPVRNSSAVGFFVGVCVPKIPGLHSVCERYGDILCVLDRASSWYLNKGRPTWCHLFYYVSLLLNMFWMLIHPSSGACDCLVCYCIGCIVLAWDVLVLHSGLAFTAQYSLCNNTQSSRKLLKMVVLTSETCWAIYWHNKASDIKLVYLYSDMGIVRWGLREPTSILQTLLL